MKVISNLAMPEEIDMGSTIGSYAGLMLLISAYSSIFSRQPYPIIKSWLLSSPYFLCFFSILDLKDYPPLPSFSTIIAAFEQEDHFKSMDGCDRETCYILWV
jgi:ABC-2 type transport system permease protein